MVFWIPLPKKNQSLSEQHTDGGIFLKMAIYSSKKTRELLKIKAINERGSIKTDKKKKVSK